jgi:hypothetical protein
MTCLLGIAARREPLADMQVWIGTAPASSETFFDRISALVHATGEEEKPCQAQAYFERF